MASWYYASAAAEIVIKPILSHTGRSTCHSPCYPLVGGGRTHTSEVHVDAGTSGDGGDSNGRGTNFQARWWVTRTEVSQIPSQACGEGLNG
jgi:hypothetical protein